MIELELEYKEAQYDAPVRYWEFPSGCESGLELSPPTILRISRGEDVTIHARLNSHRNIMRLLLLTDAIRRVKHNARIVLAVFYFPYARQDRLMQSGQSLSAKVMCDMINAQKYDGVVILDPHSDVIGALLDRVQVNDSYSFARKAITSFLVNYSRQDLSAGAEVTLIVPDAGATKRVNALGKILTRDDMISKVSVVLSEKIREVSTGNIVGQKVFAPSEGLEDKDVFIYDDICDGGRTFIGLAEILKRDFKVRNAVLIVTHGIFSNGFSSILEHIDHVYTTTSFHSEISFARVHAMSAEEAIRG